MSCVTDLDTDNLEEISYIQRLTKTATKGKVLSGDSYTLLSGLDPIAQELNSLLSKDNPRLFKNYFVYTTLPKDTKTTNNLMKELEAVTPLLCSLLKEYPSLPNILDIKNLGWELWWDNMPVQFTYTPEKNKPFYLTFKNGRTHYTTSETLSLCSELSSNIQLSIAACLGKELDFYLNLNTVKYDRHLKLYNYLPVISYAYCETLQKLYDLLKLQVVVGDEYTIKDTKITFCTHTFKFKNKDITLPDNEIINILLIKALIKQLN